MLMLNLLRFLLLFILLRQFTKERQGSADAK